MQADALAMVEHGLKYLLNCYIKDPTDYGNAEGDIYVYQVGDIVKERRRWFRPEDVTVCISTACALYPGTTSFLLCTSDPSTKAEQFCAIFGTDIVACRRKKKCTTLEVWRRQSISQGR